MYMQKLTVVAAATTNNNLYAGTYLENMPSAGLLNFAFSGGGVGITSDEVEIQVICGGETLVLEWNPTVSGAAEPTPIKNPDDFTLSCPALPGDRIIAVVRNKDGAVALRLLWAVSFEAA